MDPLAQSNDDMHDLSAELDAALTNFRQPHRSSSNGTDLDGRFTSVKAFNSGVCEGVDSHDLGLTSPGHLHLTYGHLVNPPSYEDSVLYESVSASTAGLGPLLLHAHSATSSASLVPSAPPSAASSGGRAIPAPAYPPARTSPPTSYPTPIAAATAAAAGAGGRGGGGGEGGGEDVHLGNGSRVGQSRLGSPPSDSEAAWASAEPAWQQQQQQQQQGPPGLGGAGRLGLPCRSARGCGLAVTVSDPVKREQQGLFGIRAGYVAYLVSTQVLAPLPGFPPPSHAAAAAAAGGEAGGEAGSAVGGVAAGRGQQQGVGAQLAVRRRFRDFVALADLLKVRFRGLFLPPRPDKNVVEGQRMANGFVEERRAALERYLVRLTQHPTLVVCEELRVFLSAEGELELAPAWCSLRPAPKAGLVEGTALLSKQLLGLEKSVVDPVQATQPTKSSADILRAMRETAQSMQASASSTPALPPGEVQLRAAKEQVEAMKEALASASRAAEKLVHALDRVAGVAGDAGLAFFKLSKFEEQDGPHMAQFTGTVRQSQALSSGSKMLGSSLVRASRQGRKAADKAALELGVMHEHLADMPSAIKGLGTREKQLLTADTLAADLAARQRAIKELEASGPRTLGGEAGKVGRLQELRGDVSKLECSIQAARAEYQRIASVNQQEQARQQADYAADMCSMCQGLAQLQALNAQRVGQVWLQLALELGVPQEQLASAGESLLLPAAAD